MSRKVIDRKGQKLENPATPVMDEDDEGLLWLDMGQRAVSVPGGEIGPEETPDIVKVVNNDGFGGLTIAEEHPDGDKNGEKSKKKAKGFASPVSKKKKKKGIEYDESLSSGEVVEIAGNGGTDQFVILGESKNASKKVGAVIKWILGIFAFFVMVIMTYALLQYRLVPECVVGENYNINGMSVVSRDEQYRVEPKQLRDGDLLLISDCPDWFPVVYDYQVVTFRGNKGGIIFILNENGMTDRVEPRQISFVLQRNE